MQQTANPDLIGDVMKFCLAAGHDVAYLPHIPTKDKRDRRLSLNKEEWKELMSWLQHPDMTTKRVDGWDEEARIKALTEIGDAIVDLIYVLIGCAFQYGIPIAEVWREVQRANEAKIIDGKVQYRQDGKVLKPPGWSPPNVEKIIRDNIEMARIRNSIVVPNTTRTHDFTSSPQES